jgi:hypothetical protein
MIQILAAALALTFIKSTHLEIASSMAVMQANGGNM